MNAMEAATQINWRSSITYHEGVRIQASAPQVLEFNSRVAMEPGFADQVEQQPDAILSRYGMAQWASYIPQSLDGTVVPSSKREEFADVLIAAEITGFKNRDEVLRTFESNLRQSPYAQPMLAAIVVVAAVYFWLWVRAEIP